MHPDEMRPPGKQEFLYPRSKYYGKFSPENLAFNANLQEFSQRISYLCSLEVGGKLTPYEAYEGIKEAWETLNRSRAGLHIGDP
ncbi:hypothetical protein XM38_020500 [Halomicronema hongdechloris C2206]|uniref:Uncharacterized protein n=2 Tax=Halomicronema hongdechloris TaxID=1209493 RepID=A0A1Z3HLC8_9CYAN|nr:hypothetical protein XM38_020500 [Halomicronema hongdechloris C2206]